MYLKTTRCLRSKGYRVTRTKIHGSVRLDIYDGSRLVASAWIGRSGLEKLVVLDKEASRRVTSCFLLHTGDNRVRAHTPGPKQLHVRIRDRDLGQY